MSDPKAVEDERSEREVTKLEVHFNNGFVSSGEGKQAQQLWDALHEAWAAMKGDPPEFVELKEGPKLRMLAQMVTEQPCFTNAILAVTDAYKAGWAARAASRREPLRELLCQRCSRDYPVWFAPNELWNKVTDEHDHFLCMDCFAILAESKGIKPTAWMVSEENLDLSVALEKIRRLEHPELGPSMMETGASRREGGQE